MQKKLPVLVALGLALGSAPLGAHADGCNVHQLRGTYATSCQGFVSPQAGVFLPFALLGPLSVDGNGLFTSTYNASLGGQQVVERIEGTPQLKDDCTGQVTLDVHLVTGEPPITPPTISLAFVVLDHGDRIRAIGTDPGTTYSCQMERISTAPAR